MTHIHCIMISLIKSVHQILNKRGQAGLKRFFNTDRTRKRSEVLNQSKREVLLQCGKKVVSDSQRLVDYVTGLVNSVLNLPDGQVKFSEEFKLQKNCKIDSAHQKGFGAS